MRSYAINSVVYDHLVGKGNHICDPHPPYHYLNRAPLLISWVTSFQVITFKSVVRKDGSIGNLIVRKTVI